jgi:hypothetical protein
MKTFFVWVLFGGLLSLRLMAQDNPKLEVFGGYQYLNIGLYGTRPFNAGAFNGWNAAAAANLSKYFGVEGDFGGAYNYLTISRVSLKIYTYSGGPVVYMNKGRIKPFVHALVGGIHLTTSQSGAPSLSQNGYTVMAGGGVDAKVNRVIAIRLAQADWLYYNFSNTTLQGAEILGFSHSNNVRISTGVVLRF